MTRLCANEVFQRDREPDHCGSASEADGSASRAVRHLGTTNVAGSQYIHCYACVNRAGGAAAHLARRISNQSFSRSDITLCRFSLHKLWKYPFFEFAYIRVGRITPTSGGSLRLLKAGRVEWIALRTKLKGWSAMISAFPSSTQH